MALSLMPVLPPDEVADLLEERLGRLETDIATLRAALERSTTQGLERRFVIEAEYELAMREAERAFHVRARKSRSQTTAGSCTAAEDRAGARRQKKETK